MPMTADDLADIKPKLDVAKRAPVNFAACMGTSPQNMAIIFSKTKDPKLLLPLAKKAADTLKTTYGTLTVADGVITLRCAEEVPTGLCKMLKSLFTSQKVSMRVKALDSNGVEVDGESTLQKPAAPAGNETIVDGTQETAGTGTNDQSSANERSTESQGNDRAAGWAKIVDQLDPRVTDYVNGAGEKATQVAAAWKAARGLADVGKFDDAMAFVTKIMPLLRPGTTGQPASTTTDSQTVIPAGAGSASDVDENRAPQDAPEQDPSTDGTSDATASEYGKAALIWRGSVRAMQAEMEKLEAAIAAHLSPDPRMEDIVADVADLSDRLEVFDLALAQTLDAIDDAEPEARDTLRREAAGHIRRYTAALDTPFFRDVDDGNGFVSVAVAATARRSLGALGKILA